MEFINNAVSAVNDALYTYALIILLAAAGIYFTLRGRFLQFRLLKEQFKASSVGLPDKTDYWN